MLQQPMSTLSLLIFLCVPWCGAGSLRGINTTSVFVRPTAYFRILLFATTIEVNGEPSTSEKISSVPIVGGKEIMDALYDIQLPEAIFQKHYGKIALGNLFIAITDSEIRNERVVLKPSSTVEVILDPRQRTRNSKPVARGRKTITIVRISTLDATPSNSAESLKDGLFSPDKINLRTQFEACSFGQLHFELSQHGVIEVKVQQPVSDFTSGSALVTAAQYVMRDKLKIKDPSKLSDKVMMCLPPGTGNWVASSGVGHWRSQYNDKWCRSLTATMHELGHGLGLTHANENGAKYGDATGYMAAGHRQYYWPRKCFNGVKNHQLGWYFTREKRIKTSELKAGRLINLATFVDFNRTSYNEPVIVNIDDEVFLQYNVAKAFNKDTEEKRDEVTVTSPTSSGSDALAGLKPGQKISIPGFRGTSRSLVIDACRQRSGSMGADVMLISVSLDRSLCNQIFSDYFQNHLNTLVALAPDKAPSIPVPKKTPVTASPRQTPTRSPTNAPTQSPTRSPTSVPIQGPTQPPPTPAPLGFWDLLKALGIDRPGSRDTKLKGSRPPETLPIIDTVGSNHQINAYDNDHGLGESNSEQYASGVKSVFDHDTP